jgi:hypothetical protein
MHQMEKLLTKGKAMAQYLITPSGAGINLSKIVSFQIESDLDVRFFFESGYSCRVALKESTSRFEIAKILEYAKTFQDQYIKWQVAFDFARKEKM